MTLLSALIFLPTIFSGTLVVHLLWPEKNLLAFPLKFSLGIGLGLGISSILYFLVLQAMPGRVNMLTVQIILLILLLAITFLRGRNQKWEEIRLPALSYFQWILFGVFFLASIMAVLVFINTIISRPQGVLDAWSIWNRAARFIYRDPENWQATLSPDLALFRHADYPLLVPLNVAWGWETLGNETLRVPMLQSALFTFSVVMVMFSALAFTRTIGQASLASVVLIAFTGVVVEGTYLIADVPVMYFILTSGILMYLFTVRNESSLLILSGFMAGLAGWTKNEGLLFIAVSPIALIVASPKNLKRSFLPYLAGLAIPLLIIFYFKSLTPPNDLLNNNSTSLIERITDLSRYSIILKSFTSSFLNRSLIFLLFYTVIMHNDLSTVFRQGSYAIFALLVLQLLGYAAIYLITPNDLEWHLHTSQSRLFLQILPLALFLCFSISSDPESVFLNGFQKTSVDQF
ncbi:MAG: hypothetical protein HOP27_04395 [Anaerolineales bacterium]|nr:hypothetical protein [Anaerolineales bacterium]